MWFDVNLERCQEEDSLKISLGRQFFWGAGWDKVLREVGCGHSNLGMNAN